MCYTNKADLTWLTNRLRATLTNQRRESQTHPTGKSTSHPRRGAARRAGLPPPPPPPPLRENYSAFPLRSLRRLGAHIALLYIRSPSFKHHTPLGFPLNTGAGETMADPLRSATAGANIDDTSLAVPADNARRSGAQRVLDQVHTIKRSKSRQKNGTGSPTSRIMVMT